MDAVKKNNAAAPDLPNPQCPSEPKTHRIHDQMLRTDGHAAACCNAGVPAAVLMIFLGCILVGTVRQVRDRPRDLAFLAFAYADLAALFLCLRRAERLPREPSPEEGADEQRRRLQLVVWTLSAALSCAFAYRVSLLIMPPVLVVAVWSMTSFVAVVGFFVLVL
ncbi:uncharacterized protein C2845_PM05G25870 [Panicum miliaceum]|uniref:Uncharacterized protein n=1 Tax=Panicum miliaceum TaxID=4540 RepID=A0A3L6T5N3_PANMI|nr:uncharacterized protein C2845_PM05G25870 [Panicum miliaceum]